MTKKKDKEELNDILSALNKLGIEVYKIIEPMIPIIIDVATVLRAQELELIEKDSEGNLIELE